MIIKVCLSLIVSNPFFPNLLHGLFDIWQIIGNSDMSCSHPLDKSYPKYPPWPIPQPKWVTLYPNKPPCVIVTLSDSSWSRCRSVIIAQMSQFRCSHYPIVNSAADGTSSYCILMVLNSLVTTLADLLFMGTFPFKVQTKHQNIGEPHKIVSWGLLDPKYLFLIFIAFPYKKRFRSGMI